MITAPAVNPWDVETIAARALAVLRLDPADADADRINESAHVATELVDELLDLSVPYADAASIPAAVTGAAVVLVVEDYRRKDAPFGLTDSWSADGAFLRLPADVYKGVRAQLARFRDRRGLA